MKRFWMLVGVAVVAGAMYVAAAPGSRQAAGPTARQFAALQKQVASLNKNLKALKKDEAQVKLAAGAAVGYIATCFLDTSGSNVVTLAVDQLGTTSTGFLFGPPGGAGSTARTALDIDTTGSPMAYLQEVNTACATNSASALPHSLKLLERSR
ncbi:MAG TPA: hypothetical protein VKE27_05715 [Candidatus Dormibacteraeota bacterium]|nr:hypothetical protein [Candidatus Dormibacteraeota bacterium]